jgi:hypothetical protein
LSANALEQESGRGKIELLACMPFFMDFFAIPGLYYITNGSQLFSTQKGCRIDKILGKRTFTPRTTWM